MNPIHMHLIMLELSDGPCCLVLGNPNPAWEPMLVNVDRYTTTYKPQRYD